MDARHIFLGRPWQFDTDATHKGRDNLYVFNLGSHKIVMAPVNDSGKPKKLAANSSFLTITSNECDCLEATKDAETIYLVVMKRLLAVVLEKVEIPNEARKILQGFKKLIDDDLLNQLPPIWDIQHHIDLVHVANLPNLPHYRMSPKENDILQKKIEELLQKRVYP
ncbi:unnamed protein product [Prunus armeniaca]